MNELPLCLAPGLLGDMTIEKEEIVNLNVIERIKYPGFERRFAFVPLVGTYSQYLLLHHMINEVEAGKATLTNQIDNERHGGIWFEYFDNDKYPEPKACAVEYLREYLDIVDRYVKLKWDNPCSKTVFTALENQW
ncbi:hypothetical protein P168DRAFT_284889 [Aspergillus campestris IBT 28561]|uniref:Uncharacterized protein n=1 Tax=Aspergillus campestris (strain IBT 28561) TaxID=1392248 RepID=A0A2I1CSX6_ASPC2|nr:uncharacterized protein P168DRAFT_284889 [Aspergillus campestris IBT 28561]PKY00717.1 hypothetical protein P168DRAFT_284889 [Aspergillus campestris IBT 28561]